MSWFVLRSIYLTIHTHICIYMYKLYGGDCSTEEMRMTKWANGFLRECGMACMVSAKVCVHSVYGPMDMYAVRSLGNYIHLGEQAKCCNECKLKQALSAYTSSLSLSPSTHPSIYCLLSLFVLKSSGMGPEKIYAKKNTQNGRMDIIYYETSFASLLFVCAMRFVRKATQN